MSLPPYARALDVRATRAAFAAGTLSTVRDHPTAENKQRLVELRHADGYDADVVKHEESLRRSAEILGESLLPKELWDGIDKYQREAKRQAFLARAQYVDPRERRA